MITKKSMEGNGGFTLIEAVISASILTVGLLTAIYMVGWGMNARRLGKDVTISNNIMKDVVESMKARGYTSGINEMSTHPAVTGYEYGPVTNIMTLPPRALVKQTVTTSGKRFHVWVSAEENKPKPLLCQVTVYVNWSTVGTSNAAAHTMTTAGYPHRVSSTIYFSM